MAPHKFIETGLLATEFDLVVRDTLLDVCFKPLHLGSMDVQVNDGSVDGLRRPEFLAC